MLLTVEDLDLLDAQTVAAIEALSNALMRDVIENFGLETAGARLAKIYTLQNRVTVRRAQTDERKKTLTFSGIQSRSANRLWSQNFSLWIYVRNLGLNGVCRLNTSRQRRKKRALKPSNRSRRRLQPPQSSDLNSE